MVAISKKEYSRYFFIIFLLVLIVLTFLLLKSFITPILLAIILAYAFHPLYQKLNLKYKSLNAILMVILILIIIAIPLSIVVKSVVDQGTSFYNYFASPSYNFSPFLQEILQKSASSFINILTPSLNLIKNALLSSLIFIFFLFYFLKDGKFIIKSFTKIIPLEKNQKARFISEFHQITKGVVYGLVFVGIIQGILGAITLNFLNIPSPILWGVLMMILSILPIIGPPIIWVPMTIIRFLHHDYISAIVLIVMGIIMGALDLFLKPKLIGKKSHIHPLLVVVGVFGGLKVIGISGIIFGPLILVTLIILIQYITKKEVKNEVKDKGS